MFYRMKTNIVC